jgi:hypothetical protein
VLDLDIWRARVPGADEAFDAERFGVWIEVLMDTGAAIAAEKLAALDIDLVTAGVARHAAVYDYAAISGYTMLDGKEIPGWAQSGGVWAEIGGYLIEARRTSAWNAIVDLLGFLAAEDGEYFHRLMRGCVRLSSGTTEEDAFHSLPDAGEQQIFEVAVDREVRRDQQGYVAPALAHAFLEAARDVRLDADRPPPSPIARAYFRALEPERGASTDTVQRNSPAEAVSPVDRPATDDVLEILREAGVLTPEPRALLGAADSQPSRLSFIEAFLASRSIGFEELGYLANALLSGCAVHGRPFTAREATDAAAAICNLGLQNWPPRWGDADLTDAFQVGWVILQRDVCIYAAERLVMALGEIRCTDRDVQLSLEGLRRTLLLHLGNGEPWRAASALDAIMMLDVVCWAGLSALIAECPVAHAAVSAPRQSIRKIDPAAFEFIAENSQIAAVRTFLASLADALAG